MVRYGVESRRRGLRHAEAARERVSKALHSHVIPIALLGFLLFVLALDLENDQGFFVWLVGELRDNSLRIRLNFTRSIFGKNVFACQANFVKLSQNSLQCLLVLLSSGGTLLHG